MALGRKRAKQTSMWVAGTKLQRGPRHAFYERLESLLVGAEFDRRVEGWCSPYYEAAGQPGRPSVPPGVYFRMLLVGYFEGIEAEIRVPSGVDQRTVRRCFGRQTFRPAY